MPRTRMGPVGLLSLIVVIVAVVASGLLPREAEAQRVEPGGAPPAGSGSLDVSGFVRVIDGDTIETYVDGKRTGIGLIGIDAPQGNTECGREAADRLRAFVRGGLRLEEDAALTFDARGRRLYYGKALDGKAIAKELIAAGVAKANGRGKEHAELSAEEVRARGARAGCAWGAVRLGRAGGGEPGDGQAGDGGPGATGFAKLAEPAPGREIRAVTAAPAAAATLPSGFSEEVVAPGAATAGGLSNPTAFTFLPDGRILIAQKNGVVRVYKNGALLATPFLDLQGRVNDYWDRGLLGIAADPNFATNRYVYLLYTYENDEAQYNSTKTARLTRVTAAGDTAPPNSEVVLVGKSVGSSCNAFPAGTDCIPSDSPSHSIGNMKFAPDGTLLVTLGDGAHFNFVDDNALRAQNLDLLSGKVLRINTAGQGVSGNPFWNGSAGANRSKVWSLGVRNAFRFNLKPGTGIPFLGDVGWNGWEEVNVATAGANLGWPCYEGSARQAGYEPKAACQTLYGQGTGAVKAPLAPWSHNGRSAAATGGAFYTGTSYPSAYQSAYFYADYAQNWVRSLKVDANNALVGTPTDFATTADGPVAMEMAPDGNLYYVAFRSGELRRIRYAGGGGPTTCAGGQYLAEYFANRTLSGTPAVRRCEASIAYDWGSGSPVGGIGADNFSVRWTGRHTFSAAAYTFTARADDGVRVFLDGTALIDQWKDQAPTTYTATRNVSAGEREVKVEYYENGGGAVAQVSWQASASNTAPTPTIGAPASTTTFKVGDVVAYSGSATDAQDGTIPAGGLSWEVILHHCPGGTCHAHPFTPGGSSTGTSGSFTVPDHGDESHFEIKLTATDSGGLKATVSRTIQPQTVQVTLSTSPTGLQVVYDGTAAPAPLTKATIVGSTHTISVPSPQGSSTFQSWSDGGAQQHNVTVGASPATYTATFAGGGGTPTTTYLSDRAWTSATNGWGPVEKDRSNGEQAAGDGRAIRMSGKTYAKGLGAHANSDVRYALGGKCSRLQADVGLDDEVGSNGSVSFQVWADGARLFESPRMTGASATVPVSVDLTGKQELRLVITDAGNNNYYDHADWADARVTCTP